MIKPYLIAEAGCTHMGNMDMVIKSVQMAKLAGFDCIKFQKRDINLLSKQALSQKRTWLDGEVIDYFDYRKRLELSSENINTIVNKCKELDIDLMFSVWDVPSLKTIYAYDYISIKIPSPLATKREFLTIVSDIVDSDRELYISTGMINNRELRHIINNIFNMHDIIIFHCVSNYPTNNVDANMRSIKYMRDEYKNDIGFSDHSPKDCDIQSIIATTMDCAFIERHIHPYLQNIDIPYPDKDISLGWNDMLRFVSMVKTVVETMGSYKKEVNNKSLEKMYLCPDNTE